MRPQGLNLRCRRVAGCRARLLSCAVLWAASSASLPLAALEDGVASLDFQQILQQRTDPLTTWAQPRPFALGDGVGMDAKAPIGRTARRWTDRWTVQPAAEPHPAVARIIVAEGLATSYGSGTLIDLRDDYGLVVTNWHVVRDAQGDIEVLFSDGFSSKARALKVDPDWDLAALVIWRPNAAPVKIAAVAPQPGDRLTICGYGQGQYREATGRCTKYYAPRLNFPEHMVELDVEARQGDSGGPIFNDRGELAGVLFGAGKGTTLGSFGGRVQSFLASLAPDIGVESSQADAPRTDRWIDQSSGAPKPQNGLPEHSAPPLSPGGRSSAQLRSVATDRPNAATSKASHPDSVGQDQQHLATPNSDRWQSAAANREQTSTESHAQRSFAARQMGWFDHIKSVLAAVGVVAIVVQLLKAVR